MTSTAALVVHSGLAIVITGPRTPWNGSKIPQDVCPAPEAAADFADAPEASGLATPPFFRRFPFPLSLVAVFARPRGAMEALRDLTSSFPNAV